MKDDKSKIVQVKRIIEAKMMLKIKENKVKLEKVGEVGGQSESEGQRNNLS